MELKRRLSQQVEIPDLVEWRARARAVCENLAVDDWDFYKLMRQFVPRVEVYPYQPCDGGTTVLRARFRVHPAALLDDPRPSRCGCVNRDC